MEGLDRGERPAAFLGVREGFGLAIAWAPKMVRRPPRLVWCPAPPGPGNLCAAARSTLASSLIRACGRAPKAASRSMWPAKRLAWRCSDHVGGCSSFHRWLPRRLIQCVRSCVPPRIAGVVYAAFSLAISLMISRYYAALLPFRRLWRAPFGILLRRGRASSLPAGGIPSVTAILGTIFHRTCCLGTSSNPLA